MLKNKKGFTLIELLIVVAIIAILAAIAIPQFAAYRMRGFNAAAVSDCRNTKTAEEAAFTDFGGYGKNQTGTLAAATNTAAALGATYLVGPLVAADQAVSGALLSGPTTAGTAFGIPTAVSNGNMITAGSVAPVAPALASASYVMLCKHTNGDRVIGAETDSTSMWFVQNGLWAGSALSLPPAGFVAPGLLTATQDLAATIAAGGSPNANWAAM
jgi:prepilin-type N-terminal cleavage/methylation domain-containing protein